MRRLLVLVLGLLTAWLGSGAPASALPTPTRTVAVYEYGGNCRTAALTDNINDRGPPAVAHPHTTYDSVDRWSHGDSARLGATPAPAGTTYDGLGLLIQVARVARTTEQQAQVIYGGLCLRSSAGVAANAGAKLGWSTGDDIYSLTKAGNRPAWSTVRGRFWKNEASSPQYGSWTDEQLARMRTGRAPQRYNPDKGGIESMDLSHEPIPFRDGGTAVVPKWPQEHAAVPPFRRPGY